MSIEAGIHAQYEKLGQWIFAVNARGGNRRRRGRVLLENELGGFRTAASILMGTSPFLVPAGGFKGDIGPDIALANGRSNNVSVRLDQTQ